MSRKRYSAEQIIGKLREAEVLIAKGQSIRQAAKALGITDQTYYRWRKEHCGLRTLNAAPGTYVPHDRGGVNSFPASARSGTSGRSPRYPEGLERTDWCLTTQSPPSWHEQPSG